MSAKVYLSGPIKDRTKEQIHGWRDEFKQLYGEENCIDPTARVFTHVRFDPLRTKEIIEKDKIDIIRSDVTLVYYAEPTAGTCMEVIYAWTMGKTVIVVCENDKVYETLSVWMTYHATFITTSLQAAKIYIEDYYGRF